MKTYSYDLRARYTATVEARHVKITPREVDVTYSVEIAAPPSTVWTWLNDPPRLEEWMGVDAMKPVARPEERNGIGARNHCHHGKSVAVQTILDWRPYDYFTLESTGPMTIRMTHILTPTETGTRLVTTWKADTKLPSLLAKSGCKLFFKAAKMDAKIQRLSELCSGERGVTVEGAVLHATART